MGLRSFLDKLFGRGKPAHPPWSRPAADDLLEDRGLAPPPGKLSPAKPKTAPPIEEEIPWARPSADDLIGLGGEERQPAAATWTEWYPLISTNVDRIRYHPGTEELQVVFKSGALYQYEDIEPEVFQSFLQTHSPGQFVWYVLRAYGYPYEKLSEGHAASPPANDRFSGEPFAVPKHIEDLQRRKGSTVDQVPVARGVAPPPPTWKGRP